jgi:hypothetical protein
MAHDERERNFDKALARHLRSAAFSGAGADEPTGSSAQRETCANAETLAAYHERLLLPAEMNSWKGHISGCVRCRDILAQLEVTDEISAVVVGEGERPEMLESPSRMSAERIAAPRQTFRTSPGSQLSPPRATRWRWLAPAGALAAGLLVWVAVHENQQPSFPSHEEVQIAKNHVPLVVTPLPPPAGTPPEAEREKAKLPSTPGDTASADKRAAVDEMMRRQSAELSARVATAPLAALQAKSDHADLPPKPGADAGSTARMEASSGTAQEFKRSSNAAVALEASPRPLAREQVRLGAPRPASAAQLPPSEPPPSEKKNSTSPPAAAALAMTAESGVQDQTTLYLTKSSSSRTISPPDGEVTWNVGSAGLIEFSTDQGKTWTQQSSGVTADLLAGSAPFGNVCWVVGRKGTILVTTDNGAHWRQVTPPTSGDVSRIHAVDRLHATIWASRQSFKTSDGGLSWTPVANQ